MLSQALTLPRLEKPPVLCSSDSATFDSLCVLWTEPSGLVIVICSHSRTSAESLEKRIGLLLFGTHFLSSTEERQGRELCGRELTCSSSFT